MYEWLLQKNWNPLTSSYSVFYGAKRCSSSMTETGMIDVLQWACPWREEANSCHALLRSNVPLGTCAVAYVL